MEIKYSVNCGTLESSDIQVLVEPLESGSGRVIEFESIVKKQFGKDITNEITSILDKFEVQDIHLIANDKGALAPTIKARVETAVKRAAGLQEGTFYDPK